MPLDNIYNEQSASAVRAAINAAIDQVDTNTTDIAGKQPLDTDLTTIAALTPTNDDVLQRKAGAWTNRSIAQLSSDLNLSGKQDANSLDTTLWRITETTGNVTLALGDNKRCFVVRNSGATVVNVPLNASEAFVIGTEIKIINEAASTNDVTITPAGGVTVGFVNGASLAMAPQTGAHLIKVNTDKWILQY